MGSIVINSSWAMFLDLEMVKMMSPLPSQSHPGMGRTPPDECQKKIVLFFQVHIFKRIRT
jgi:hypothetical protein